MRAKQARTPSEEFSNSLTIYWQITFNAGYLAMHGKIVSLLRCLVVKATEGVSSLAEQADESGDEKPDGKMQTDVLVSAAVPVEQEDQPKKRALYRRIFLLFALQALVPFVIGMLAGDDYPNAEIDATHASSVQTLRSVVCISLTADILTFDHRYVTAGFIVVLVHIFHGLAAWAMFKIPRIKRDAVLVLVVLESILVRRSPFFIQAPVMTFVT